MRKLLLMLFLFLISATTYSQVSVKGYYKSNGTYVQPHERTPPNSTITDNYSYPGNYNPNKGAVTSSSNTYYGSTTGESKYVPAISITPPSYVPHEQRNYMVNPKGETYGYSYTIKTNTVFQTFFIYDIKNALQFLLNQYPNGDMFVYAPNGQFVKYFNKNRQQP